ncbi:helix-turn-helix domain-containing protein [Tenacibaculum agarivorans]|uniref:helix-turn-helix domain-containing protein n=1 Tax=Tenacibaculum agarivorans TaxID=1908389 RepID=UPI0009FA9A22|nr:AraC family transcriptional regulator [Tenacibaculum agarivorans]
MMSVELRLDISAFIILVGIVLGFLLSYFFIQKSFKHNKANIFLGLLLLTFTLNMLEGWLNYTGLIFRALHLTNFSEPTNFIIAPLLYLFVSRQLAEKPSKNEWIHYIPFVLWLLYCVFFFKQSADFKYNSNIYALGFDLNPLEIDYSKANDNPFGIRSYVNELTILHITIYSLFLLRKIVRKSKSLGESIFTTSNHTLKSLRSSVFHFIALLVLLIIVKATFKNDFGDYILYIYLSFILLLTMFQVMNSSLYFEESSSFLEFPTLKYQKSSLTKKDKKSIAEKVKMKMEKEYYYKSNLASLSDLAFHINESSHHVSQVINEELKLSFFELLAKYRIEEAKIILASVEGKKLTIEEIAERVGYNSKSAFNTSFKKLTNTTPSSYRKAN